MRYSLDATTDYSFKELHSFLDSNIIPDFVKSADYLDKAAADLLPDEAFADRCHRAFPISSAADVYVSNAYYINKKAELQKLWGDNYVNGVETRITKAAEMFAIEKDIATYNANLNEKQASDYSEKCVASFEIGGSQYDLFPYKTAEDLKFQANQFTANLNNYPFIWRPKIASEFIKQAADLGVDELPDIVCKYGGLFFPDVREFQDTLERRMRKLSENFQDKYKPVIEKAASISSREDALAVCNEAYLIEKSAGVYEKPLLYREFGDIVDRTMVLNLSKIAELLDVVKIGDDCYSMPDLQKISADVYKQAFEAIIDPSNANELRDILPTMPRSDFALLRELSGISPVSF